MEDGHFDGCYDVRLVFKESPAIFVDIYSSFVGNDVMLFDSFLSCLIVSSVVTLWGCLISPLMTCFDDIR